LPWFPGFSSPDWLLMAYSTHELTAGTKLDPARHENDEKMIKQRIGRYRERHFLTIARLKYRVTVIPWFREI
jgi:hypothetical protein